MDISRRQFLAFGSTAAMGVAAASLVGCGPKQSESAIGEAGVSGLSSENGLSFMVAPDPIDPAQISDTKEYDVVVVGAGTAGVPAAISAKKNGASVCVVQKESTAVAQGSTAAGVSLERSTEAGIQYLISQTMKENQYRCKRSLFELWARRSGEALEYIAEYGKDGEYPATLSINDRFPEGYLDTYYPDTDDKVATFSMRCGAKPIGWMDGINSLAKIAEEDGIDFFYNTPGEQLVQAEDGSITGVICKTKEGEYIQFNAKKGVILATGDYQNDEEMVAHYLPDMVIYDKKQLNKTGDGHKMAMWVGGQMESIGHTKMVHDFDSGPMYNEPFLDVDMKGERFCDEHIDMSLLNNFLRDAELPGHYCQIFDANYVEQVEGWGGRPADPEALKMFMPEEDVAERKGVRADLVATFKADTLKDLAAKLGIVDAEAFEKTVARYNELVAKGLDEDFGKEAKYLKPIDTPPFYGVHNHVRLSAIVSGIKIDENMNVVDANEEPIKGLYAVGNTSGEFFGGVDYPLAIAGLSVGRAITGGYIAGENAAKA